MIGILVDLKDRLRGVVLMVWFRRVMLMVHLVVTLVWVVDDWLLVDDIVLLSIVVVENLWHLLLVKMIIAMVQFVGHIVLVLGLAVQALSLIVVVLGLAHMAVFVTWQLQLLPTVVVPILVVHSWMPVAEDAALVVENRRAPMADDSTFIVENIWLLVDNLWFLILADWFAMSIDWLIMVRMAVDDMAVVWLHIPHNIIAVMLRLHLVVFRVVPFWDQLSSVLV